MFNKARSGQTEINPISDISNIKDLEIVKARDAITSVICSDLNLSSGLHSAGCDAHHSSICLRFHHFHRVQSSTIISCGQTSGHHWELTFEVKYSYYIILYLNTRFSLFL